MIKKAMPRPASNGGIIKRSSLSTVVIYLYLFIVYDGTNKNTAARTTVFFY
ncbi:hypothetical protein PAUR_a0070 [Pseudoalteromonas aurantia 208]|uniref:Uncharacterized protein n=1 Tax=Pseudoalteromonas aurantia 208 TaxID=1314867 RepID=A0ABR9E754_9GAMM|nr:hypothetical protein [Pseudoalteromonas aurantia 208]